MYDTALDEFLGRFGDSTETARPKAEAVSSLKTTGLAETATPTIEAGGMASTKDLKSVTGKKKGVTMDQASAAAGQISEMAPAAMGLLSNIKGGQFDTSAEGGGPGKAGGAIIQGAAQGAQLGQVAGPWGMAIGAVVGGGISAVAHSEAQKKYVDNRNKFNKKASTLETMERESIYRQEQGLTSLENLKALREKQLGLS